MLPNPRPPASRFLPVLALSGIGVIAGLLLGCAAQSPPVPPRLERPVAVLDLAAAQVGRAVEITFTLPTKATDGELLTKPMEIEIFRVIAPPAAVPAAAAPPGAGTGKALVAGGPAARPWVALSSRELNGRTRDGKVEYGDRLSAEDFSKLAGSVFTFRLQALTRGFRGRPIRGGFSNTATVTLLDAFRPVTGLSIDTTEKALSLTWEAPSATLKGQRASPPAGYRVYRRDGSAGAKPGLYRLVAETHETQYVDSNFEFGRLYSYKVRAILTVKGQSAESEDSIAAEIVPRDTFPPAVPGGITGLYTSDTVELIWNPNLEPDLTGYNVYRREGRAEPVKLNHEQLPSPIYRDSAVAAGHTYFYRVTALDMSGNESALSPEVEVEIPPGA